MNSAKLAINNTIYSVVRRYADAWATNDFAAISACYHDEIVFHYFGRNSLAGTHRGKAACIAVLKQVRIKTNRKLLRIEDVLTGEHFGPIMAVEQFERGDVSTEIERLFRFRVQDDQLIECWVYDEDQRLVDEHYG